MICITRGLGAPVTDAGGNVARTSAPIPVPARRRPRTVLTRWCRPGWASSSHSAGTTTEPGSQTRPRSLRARSTIITFSARSFALAASVVGSVPVPLIGRVSASRPRHERNRSGDADTTATVGAPGAPPNRRSAPCGDGLHRSSAVNRPTGSAACSHVSRRVRLTW